MEKLNIEWTVKGYRVYSPDRPTQTVAYYDENEFEIIESDILDHGYAVGKVDKK